MFEFSQQQKVCNIGNVRVGGRPGEYPTVLIGSMFFRGHKIVSDPDKGIFDKKKAKDLLDREEELSAQTGNPRIIDVIGDTGEALINYVEWVAANTSSPILVDAALPKARMEAILHFYKTEIMPRLIYNSLEGHFKEEELVCIKESGIKSAVVLPLTTKAIKPKDRVKLLKEKMLPGAERAGLENLLIDTGVMDIPSVGWSTQAIQQIKDELGLPCGCAPSNAIYLWTKLRDRGSPAFEATAALVYGLPLCWGGDFIFYGPTRNAVWAYPACAAVDSMLAYGAMNLGLRPDKKHPLYKIF
ncbi:MAG: tetrahydromethanopterin S-methyltransferase subunit H [Chloroflexota bacterium]|nr:MAG: tetrahydromethanopterin S-methyltransferase subunit H [Chloroflexota bacterium]